VYEEMFESAKSGSGSRSENFNLLSADQKTDVLGFVEWLKGQFTQNSVNSYKSHITRAMLKTAGVIDGDLTNDEKSAVRKFQEYLNQK
jgi:peptidoglycan hydrolase-like protein with peptidoglycan-binding domain